MFFAVKCRGRMDLIPQDIDSRTMLSENVSVAKYRLCVYCKWQIFSKDKIKKLKQT